MDLSQLEEAGKNVEAKFIKIRESLDAPIGIYQTISGEKLLAIALKSPREPIVINGQRLMVYIRDHSYQGYNCDYEGEIDMHPCRCFLSGNKVHFYLCNTLQEMKIKRRMPRYRIESGFVDEHIIDISDRAMLVRLALCRNCLDIFLNNAEEYTLYFKDVSSIAECGDVKKLMEHVGSLYDNEPSAKENARNFLRGI